MSATERDNFLDLDTQKAILYSSLSEVASPNVIEAMKAVPREAFVPRTQRRFAYSDRPIQLKGYTDKAAISQPRVVAQMTTLLDVTPENNVLEIGTASGYQAAILGELASWVITVEYDQRLAKLAQKKLSKLGYTNIDVLIADGSMPFIQRESVDRLMITAAVFPYIYLPVFEMLKPGGVCVAPVSGRYGNKFESHLVRFTKDDKSMKVDAVFEDFSFVPMQGYAGWETFERAFVNEQFEAFFRVNKGKV